MTDASGKISLSLTVGTTAGTLTLDATDGSSSGALMVSVSAWPPASYVVTPASSMPVAGASVSCTAQLVDMYGNASSLSGRSVAWSSVGLGGSFAMTPTLTDSSGIARATFVSNIVPATGSIHCDDGSVQGNSGVVQTQTTQYLLSASPSGPVTVGQSFSVTARSWPTPAAAARSRRAAAR